MEIHIVSSVGISCLTGTLESLASKFRGQFGDLVDVFWSTGAIYITGLSWTLMLSLSWRLLPAFAGAPLTVLLFLSIHAVHESPRFFLPYKRLDDALHVMERAARLNSASAADAQDAAQTIRLSYGNNVDGDSESNNSHAPFTHLFHLHFLRTALLLSVIALTVGTSYYGSVFASAEALFGANSDRIRCHSHSAPQISSSEHAGIFLNGSRRVAWNGLLKCNNRQTRPPCIVEHWLALLCHFPNAIIACIQLACCGTDTSSDNVMNMC